MSVWNKRHFSIYESDEKAVLKLLEETGDQISYNTNKLKEKTDLIGDHKGSWQGVKRPELADPGIAGAVIRNTENIKEKENVNKYAKYKITHDLPIHFPYYREYLTILNTSFLYPQGFYIFDDIIYIIYQPDWTNTVKKSVVITRDFISGDFISSFIINGGFGEQIVVKKENNKLYLYTKSKKSYLGKYDITNVTYRSEVNPYEEIDVGVYSNFDYCHKTKRWFIEQYSVEIGKNNKRSVIAIFNDSFELISHFTINPSISGMWNGDYTTYFSKKQGFLVNNGEIIMGCGGLFVENKDVESNYNYQGIKTVNLNGELKNSTLIKPTVFMEHLRDKNIYCERIENEGVTLYNNKKYALYCTLGDTEKSLETGLLILQFDVDNDYDLNFSECLVNEITLNYNQYNSALFPKIDKYLINPITGEKMTSIENIYSLLTESNLSKISFYTTSVSITDINGNLLPEGYLANVYNCNNSTIIIVLNGYNVGVKVYSIYKSDNVLKQKIVTGNDVDLSSYLVTGITTNKLKSIVKDGFVKICGVLTNIPTSSKPVTLIEKLPVDLIPAYNSHHVVALSGSTNGGYGTITISSTGKVTFNYDSFGSSQYLTMDINYVL